MSEPLDPSMELIEDKLIFLRDTKRAIESGDVIDFYAHVQAGIACFDEPTVARLLQTELPMMLGDFYTKRLIKFMEAALAQ